MQTLDEICSRLDFDCIKVMMQTTQKLGMGAGSLHILQHDTFYLVVSSLDCASDSIQRKAVRKQHERHVTVKHIA